MNTYSEELKGQLIAQMLPPHNRSIPDLARETGIPKDTLYTWRGKHRSPKEPAQTSGGGSLTSQEKFFLVVETAALNHHEVGEFCRRRGLFPEQLAAWREACRRANGERSGREDSVEWRNLARRNAELRVGWVGGDNPTYRGHETCPMRNPIGSSNCPPPGKCWVASTQPNLRGS